MCHRSAERGSHELPSCGKEVSKVIPITRPSHAPIQSWAAIELAAKADNKSDEGGGEVANALLRPAGASTLLPSKRTTFERCLVSIRHTRRARLRVIGCRSFIRVLGGIL